MPFQPNPDLEQALKKLSRPLAEWRRRGRRPRQIPEAIWTQAIELAALHGVGPVARGLGIDHAKLKSHLAERDRPNAALVACASDLPASPTFLEFVSGTPSCGPLGRCMVEVESHRGRKLRVRWGGLDLAGLVTLVREFSA